MRHDLTWLLCEKHLEIAPGQAVEYILCIFRPFLVVIQIEGSHVDASSFSDKNSCQHKSLVLIYTTYFLEKLLMHAVVSRENELFGAISPLIIINYYLLTKLIRLISSHRSAFFVVKAISHLRSVKKYFIALVHFFPSTPRDVGTPPIVISPLDDISTL